MVAEKATKRLSGDQNTGAGRLEGLSVPARGLTSTESSARRYMRVMLSEPVAGNTIHLPLGEMAGKPPRMNRMSLVDGIWKRTASWLFCARQGAQSTSPAPAIINAAAATDGHNHRFRDGI